MNLYLVERESFGYDVYDSFVCSAENEFNARCTHPENDWFNETRWHTSQWTTNIKELKVTLIGMAITYEEEVIHTHFHHG